MTTNDKVQPSDCVFESLFTEANMLHEHESKLSECAFMPLFLEIVRQKKIWSCGFSQDMERVMKVGSVSELEMLLLYLSNKGMRKFAQRM
jgi:hypothetical protein